MLIPELKGTFLFLIRSNIKDFTELTFLDKDTETFDKQKEPINAPAPSGYRKDEIQSTIFENLTEPQWSSIEPKNNKKTKESSKSGSINIIKLAGLVKKSNKVIKARTVCDLIESDLGR